MALLVVIAVLGVLVYVAARLRRAPAHAKFVGPLPVEVLLESMI